MQKIANANPAIDRVDEDNIDELLLEAEEAVTEERCRSL